MDALLKWAIANINTEKEDAPPRPEGWVPPKPLDPEIIDYILGKPVSLQIQECMDVVEDLKSTLENKEIALENLEMFVENIDNAANLAPLGLWPRILGQLKSPEPTIRAGAAWVCGTAVQHNPKAQKAFEYYRGLEPILEILKDDPDPEVRTKALLCVSGYTRNNIAGFKEFVQMKGLDILKICVVPAASSSLKVKALFLLHALLDEINDEALSEDQRVPPEFEQGVVNMGFIDDAIALLRSPSDIDINIAEKAL
ncbi:hsp70 nucleotide exchange factor fes1, partial [Spiromyces aspiralis]